MGATYFSVEVMQDVSMNEAYDMAVQEAISMFGNNPYNGTISTTDRPKRSKVYQTTIHEDEIDNNLLDDRLDQMGKRSVEAFRFTTRDDRVGWHFYGIASE